jgi:N utilization substance protein B
LKIRRKARVTVLQALFEIDTAHHEPDATMRWRLEEVPLPEAGETFSRELLYGVLRSQGELDAIIQRIAPEWPLDQMAPVDRNILRLAAFEILLSQSTPPKVAINEAVELAKLFGSDSSSRFVNGVLGTLFTQRHQFTVLPPVSSAEHEEEEPNPALPRQQPPSTGGSSGA